MKSSPKKLLPLILFGITVTSLFSVRPAQAGYIVTLEQVGSNVVANGTGAFNLTGLTLIGPAFFSIGIHGNQGRITTGALLIGSTAYTGLTGPTSFGSGGFFAADFGSGD